jgi:hypothetical protein
MLHDGYTLFLRVIYKQHFFEENITNMLPLEFDKSASITV